MELVYGLRFHIKAIGAKDYAINIVACGTRSCPCVYLMLLRKTRQRQVITKSTPCFAFNEGKGE